MANNGDTHRSTDAAELGAERNQLMNKYTTLSPGEVYEIVKHERDQYIERLSQMEKEIDGLKQRLNKHASGHTESLTLIFENEIQKLKLEKLNAQLEHANRLAYKAGMADISREIIHNIANVMTGALTSISSTDKLLNNLIKNKRLIKAGALLENKVQAFKEQFFEDEENKTLIEYYLHIGQKYLGLFETARANTKYASERLNEINAIIAALQEYTEIPDQLDYEHDLIKIVNDVLIMNSVALTDQKVTVQKEFSDVPLVLTQGLRIVQILNCIVSNAAEAMRPTPPDSRVLKAAVSRDDDYVKIEITDNGCGIAPADLKEVFFYDYRLKGKGYGTSLHYCANYLAKINGKIYALSDGPDKGATIGIKIPIRRRSM